MESTTVKQVIGLGNIVRGTELDTVVTTKGISEKYYRVSDEYVKPLPDSVMLKAQKDKVDFIAHVPSTKVEDILTHLADNADNAKVVAFYTGLIEDAQRKLMIKAYANQSVAFDFSLNACVEAANQENTRQRSLLVMSGDEFKLFAPSLLFALIKHYDTLGKQVSLKQVQDLIAQVRAGFASEKASMPERLLDLLDTVTASIDNASVKIILSAKRALLEVTSDLF